jgi:hypothetical protein
MIKSDVAIVKTKNIGNYSYIYPRQEHILQHLNYR